MKVGKILRSASGSVAGLALHVPARVCALATGFRTFLTVLCLMLTTLLRTGITRICAKAAKHYSLTTAKAHQLCCCIAQGCALHI